MEYITLKDLIQQEPMQLSHQISEIRQGKQWVATNFNWLGLAQAARLKATMSSRIEDCLSWGRAAVSAYAMAIEQDYLPAQSTLHLQAMYFRVTMIDDHGAIKDDILLDPELVIRWFFQCLSFTQQQVLSLLLMQTRHELSIEQVQKLRYIKQALSIIRQLPENILLRYRRELHPWFSLQSLLP